MHRKRPVRRVAVTLNGIGIAYFMAVVNSALATVTSFGVNLNAGQTAALAGLVNAALALAVHLSHRVGEVEAAGGSGAMSRAQTARIVSDATPSPHPDAPDPLPDVPAVAAG